MTVRTEPTHGDATDARRANSTRLAEAIAQSAGSWVVPSDTDLLATADPELANGPLDAFGVDSQNGLTITVGTGEAAFSGHYVASDDTGETDPVTGGAVHEVEVPANASDETVYLAVDRTRTDRIIIGTHRDISLPEARAPRIALWDVNTDGSSITATSNRRPLTQSIDFRNLRYEAGGDGEKVDRARTADSIEGSGAQDFVSAREDDIFEGSVLGLSPGDADFTAPLGSSDGERVRYKSGSADLVTHLQGGHGRIMWSWNANFDNDNSTWRAQTSGEPSAIIGLLSSTPGPGTGSGNIVFGVAPAQDNAGDPISWNTFAVNQGGDTETNGERMLVVPERGNEPDDGDIPPNSAALYVER